ncbi:hypothetical protein KVT40_001755 [Elsinoe batatas]|uniref:Guanylate-binding protein N-terminal domain-containing protein n=1 Tax=Elsinoe batatas TaxID=2601811 RepID=A0A8K0PHK3_9PEZI|nr:hypothetical protein KVT40_001755 [Elsinoe batatas]
MQTCEYKDSASFAVDVVPGQGKPKNQRNYAVKVVETTNKFVGTVKDPLNLVSVIGPARSGKSTLMNFLSGSKTELFPTSPGATTFTKGIYVPTKIVDLPTFSSLEGEPVIDATNSAVKITFVDTEGQGAVGQLYDMNLFSPALLNSKVIIYNRTGGLLTESILTDLGMMTQAGQRLRQVQSMTEGEDGALGGGATNGGNEAAPDGDFSEVRPCFGHLVVLFNRFQLSTVDDLDEAAFNRNEIRTLLRSCFQSVKVYISPDGYLKADVQEAMRKDKNRFLTIDDFEGEYLDYFKSLRTGLSNILKDPHELIQGQALTGGSIADFMPKLSDAINAQEPLNVPSLFQSSVNDAINKALIKCRKVDAAFSRELDGDINLLLADMQSTLSYMQPDTLAKLRDDAIKAAEPIKASAMTTNFTKLQTQMTSELSRIIGGLSAYIDGFFPPAQLLVAKSFLDSIYTSVSSQVIRDYKTLGESNDAAAFPVDYEKSLNNALTNQKQVLDTKWALSWNSWGAELTQRELTTVRDQIDQISNDTPAGDQKRFTGAVTTAAETVRSRVVPTIETTFQGPEKDKAAIKDRFLSELDQTVKARQALWTSNEAELFELLAKKTQQVKQRHEIRLNDSLRPKQQPMPFDILVDATLDKDQLSKWMETNKISLSKTSETLDDFDFFISRTKAAFRAQWTSADNEYNKYVQDRIDSVLVLWTKRFNESLDQINMNGLGAQVDQACNAAGTVLRDQLGQFAQEIGSLLDGSLAFNKMKRLQEDVETIVTVGRRSKLNSFNELASIFNRNLLNKTVRPVIDKTLSDTDSYTNTFSLDTVLDEKQAEFLAGAKQLADSTDGTPEQAWADFIKRTKPGLVDMVKRNGEAIGYNGDEMPFEIQKKIVNSIKDSCANMANTLGMSWINSDSFSGVEARDNGAREKSDPSNVENEKTRRVYLQNKGGYSGWRDDKITSLEFYEWTLESSDYIMGKPVITELKPTMMFAQQYPVSNVPGSAVVGGSLQVAQAITNSRADQVTFGAKITIGTDVKTPGVSPAPEVTVKKALELSLGGSVTMTNQTAFTTTFTVQGTSTVPLPAGRINTVSQVGFDQKTTIPYTAKFKFIPRVKFTGGFVRHNGVYLKREVFNQMEKDSNRVFADFSLPRLDRIKETAERNQGDWDWPRFVKEQPSKSDYWFKQLGNSGNYELYVKGRWEGITGKRIITTVTPSSTKYDFLEETE